MRNVILIFVFLNAFVFLALSSASAALLVRDIEEPRFIKHNTYQSTRFMDFLSAYDLVPGLTFEQFHNADQNNDGFISPNEFRKLVF